MEVVVIDPKEYGIEAKRADELQGNLPQLKKERDVLAKQYDDVIKMDIDNPKTSIVARELRLKIRDNRTKGIEVWHKTTKDFFLKGGQFVDAIKRKEVAVNEQMESNLETIEKHQEIKEQKRKDELKAVRLKELESYMEFVPYGIDFGLLSDDEYKKVYNGAKMQYDAKIEAEKKAEAERVENERLDKTENQRKIEIAPYVQFISESPSLRNMPDNEYDKFLDSLKESKKQYDIEQEKIRIENERLKKEAEEKEKERQEEIEKAKQEAEKIRIENEEKLEKERKEKAKIEAELKAEKERKEAEEKAKQEAESKAKQEAEKLSKAPIKKQMKVWIDSFSIPDTSIKNKQVDEINQRFESFKKWAESLVESF